MKEFCVKVILPLLTIGLLLLMFLPICKSDGKIDYFLLWILVGCPFGIGKMFMWLVPSGYGIAGTVGVVALNFIVGGLIGGCVAVYKVIYAAFYTLKTAGVLITGKH
ncbi:MAG: DUF6050 family protein [Lachnospiraceae bacterium]